MQQRPSVRGAQHSPERESTENVRGGDRVGYLERTLHCVESVPAHGAFVGADGGVQAYAPAVRFDQLITQHRRVAQRGVAAESLEWRHGVNRIAQQRHIRRAPRGNRPRRVQWHAHHAGRVRFFHQPSQQWVPAISFLECEVLKLSRGLRPGTRRETEHSRAAQQYPEQVLRQLQRVR